MNTKLQEMQSILHELASIAAQSANYDKWSDEFSRKEIVDVIFDHSAPLRKRTNYSFKISDFRELSEDQLFSLGFKIWNKDMWLIPLWIKSYIAIGEKVTHILGQEEVSEKMDTDVRFGCIAYTFKKV